MKGLNTSGTNMHKVVEQEPRWISQEDKTFQESIILSEHELRWLQFLLRDHETMTDVPGGAVTIQKRELHILRSILVKVDQTLLLLEAEGMKEKESNDEPT